VTKTISFLNQIPETLTPLSEKLRPAKWEDFIGLEALDKNLCSQLKSAQGKPPSLILWGPPGSGKTSFGRLIGNTYTFPFKEFSAVLGGVKDVREIIDAAKNYAVPTILFVDEIHRFNKAQQDSFLPHIESGRIILIGATTENPSFYLNQALLSRSKILVFKSFTEDLLTSLCKRGEQSLELTLSEDARTLLIQESAGDARRLINLLETFYASGHKLDSQEISFETLRDFLGESKGIFYDRSGDQHYQVVSAFIKSMRGSDADAALYWGFRMIEAGEDPLFIIRRMIIFASEDIGNSDPRALQIAVATHDAFEKIGLPEGKIPIAQCITYLATAPKSNRSYLAMKAAIAAVAITPKVEVPLHLRNVTSKHMQEMGYGQDYKYPHDFDGAFVQGLTYLPKELEDQKFYEPSLRGYEKTINERLAFLKERLNEKS
jgi:putative ATPase